MNALRQVLRQPGKTMAGILLIALAVAILVICVGQYSAAGITARELDDGYDTIALISDKYFWSDTVSGQKRSFQLPQEIRTWIRDTIQNRPDLVKQEAYTGSLSGYVPQMKPENFSRYPGAEQMGEFNTGNPYRCAMLEVTVMKVGTGRKEDIVELGNSAGEFQTMRRSLSLLCAARIDRVIGMEQGFASPVGKTIILTVTAYDEAELEALELEVGRKYIVYGMDYTDVQSQTLKKQISANREGYQELFGAENSVEQIWFQLECAMTVCDYSALPENTVENNEFVTLRDQRRYYTRKDDQISQTRIPAQEYIPNYCVPTVERLDTTAEAFLALEGNRLWQQALEEMEISNHGFPVLAVDKLGYQAAFARKQARIVAGRDFTEAERGGESRVCIISESLAAANGLKVGDTLQLQGYGYDLNISVQQKELMTSTAFPSAAVYSRAKGFTSEMKNYRIVGLYRQNNAWQASEDAYGFTPNTIFVPKACISGEMLTGKAGVYYSLVLQNGKMEEFRQLQEDAGYPDLFVCMDGGYAEIKNALTQYQKVSGSALWIGLGAYAVIAMVFLALFSMQQSKALATMSSLGATRGRRIKHVLVSTMAIIIPGGILGGIAGAMLWERVAARLMSSVNVRIPLKAQMSLIALGLGLAHAAVLGTAGVLLAVWTTAERSLMKRK